MNAILRHAGEHELIAAGPGEVESKRRSRTAFQTSRKAPARCLGRLKPAIYQMARVSGSGKRVHEVAADLVAAGANRRADGRVNMDRACPELAHQRVDGTANRPCRNTSPAGMNRGNGTRPCIGKQYGNSVGGANGHGGLRAVGDERVAGWTLDGPRQSASDHSYVPAVDLMRRDDAVGAEGSRKEPPIVVRGERHRTRRERMRRDRLQRPAFEHKAA